MEIKLNSEVENKLSDLAKERSCKVEDLAQEAVVYFVTNPQIARSRPTTPVPAQTREASHSDSTSNPPPPLPGTVEQSAAHAEKHGSHKEHKKTA